MRLGIWGQQAPMPPCNSQSTVQGVLTPSFTGFGRRARVPARKRAYPQAAADDAPAPAPRRKGRPPSKKPPPPAVPPLTPAGDPLSEWTMDNRKELAAFMVDPQRDDLFDETDFPSLALEEEGRGDDYDVRRREALQAKYHSQGPVVFDQERDDPRLRWKGHVVEWVANEPRYQSFEEEAKQWLWELEIESQRKEAMRLHQLHRDRGASQFGLANAMGNYMQQLEEEDVKNKTEEYAIPSWIRANIKIEENWEKFERAQHIAEGGADLVSSWSEELEKKGIPDMLARWAPELLEGEKEPDHVPDPLDVYLDGTLPGADDPEADYEAVGPSAGREPGPRETYSSLYSEEGGDDDVLTPAIDRANVRPQGQGPRWAAEEEDVLGDALNDLEGDMQPGDADDDDMDG